MSWHYVYLARAADGSLYCGYALDPDSRVAAHNAGAGAKSLRGKRPVALAYVRRFSRKTDALRYEINLKEQSHAYKAALARQWSRKQRTSQAV